MRLARQSVAPPNMSLYTKQPVVTSLPVSHCSLRQLRSNSLVPPRVPVRPSTAAASRRVQRSAQRSFRSFTTCSTASSTSVFPAGRKQARIKLPACILKCTAQQVLQQEDFDHALSTAISAGITGILLSDATGNDAAALYEAASKLKERLRGRAMLLIADRTDIADAAEADGVIVSSKGVPVVVAKRLLQQGGLVGCLVNSSSNAVKAAAEGAAILFLEGPDGSWPAASELQASKQQRSKNAIPVIATASISAADSSSLGNVTSLDGVAVDLQQSPSLAQSLSSHQASQTITQIQAVLKKLQGSDGPEAQQESAAEGQPAANGQGQSVLSGPFLTPAKEDLVESERELLQQILKLLQEATPEMAEMSMLTDALKQLDELFLLVVVGEFNSGKSSVINALLGSRYLAEGILPTTNEISMLKYAEEGKENVSQNSDGFFVRHLPAKLLQEMNVVDTPGTNVILDRQQRLTEEYVPRADLVLFVLSADRPFTESEVNFLKYIRQWGKKVVFLVNKVDILSNDGEVQEVVKFVSDNAQRLLNVDSARVMPISSRMALQAKLALQNGASTADNQQLQQDPRWTGSQFNHLEQFIYDFLVGGASAGESVRLKLQTPLFVADALLAAAQQTLKQELELVTKESLALAAVKSELDTFQSEMQQASQSQRQSGKAAVAAAVQRAQRFVDRTLRLSNLSTLSAYIFGQGPLPVSRSFQAEVLGDATMQLTNMVTEHSTWLRDNTDKQLRKYRTFAEARMQQLLSSSASAQRARHQSEPSSSDGRYEEARQQWRNAHTLGSSDEEDTSINPSTGLTARRETALQVVTQFEPSGAAALLEEEIREALVGTAGTAAGFAASGMDLISKLAACRHLCAAGAGAFGLVLTSVLQNTVEDLLAIGVASLAGYISVLGLPQKRATAKSKLERVAENFSKDVDGKVQQELEAGLAQCLADVQDSLSPVEKLAAAELSRLNKAIQQSDDLRLSLEDLKQKAANVE